MSALRAVLTVLLLLCAPALANAACPGTSSNCPSPTYNNLIVGGTATFNGSLAGSALTPLFASPRPIGSTTPAAGTFTALTATGATNLTGLLTVNNGITATGTYSNNAAIAWSTTWPGTNKLGIYSARTYTGTPTGSGFAGGDILGFSLPLNLVYASSDQLSWTTGGIVTELEISQSFGGGATAGSRSAAIISQQVLGAVAASPYPFHTGLIIAQGIGANVTGAAGGINNGIGAYYLLNGYYGRIFNNTHVHELTFAEIDFGTGGASMVGSTTDFIYGLKFVVEAPNTMTRAYHYESLLNFGAIDPANTYLFDHIIVFGDPQNTSNGFPGSPTGDLITSFAGTTGSAIDLSLLTCTNVLKGPNGFRVGCDNYVHTDRIVPVAGPSLAIMSSTGAVPIAVIAATSTTPSFYPVLTAGASAVLDSSGSAPLWLGVTQASEIDVGHTGITTKLIGDVSFTTAGGKMGFYGATTIVKATPSGACAGNTGCQALRDALGNLGLINTGSITN